MKKQNIKINETFNTYYNNRIHNGKVIMRRNNHTFVELTDPFNWRFGKTLLKLKDKDFKPVD